MAFSTQTGTDGAFGHFSPAASWLDTSERVAGHVQRLVEQLQQAQSQMFQRMSTDTQAASEEARHTTHVQDLVSLQMAYVAEEYTRLAQFYSQILAGLFSAQAQWTKDLEANAGALLGSLVNSKPPSGSTPTVPVWPAVFAPAELFQTAQATWTEMTKVMLDAIEHDLQAEPPVATASAKAEPAAESTRPARSRRATSRG